MNTAQLESMNLTELRYLRQLINEMIGERVADRRHEIRSGLQVNQTVTVDHPKTVGVDFIVEKVNRKNAKLRRVDNNVRYNVSITLIQPK